MTAPSRSRVGVVVGILVVDIVVVVGVVVVVVVVVVVSQIGVKATWDGVISRDLATGARASKSPPRRVHAHRTYKVGKDHLGGNMHFIHDLTR